MSRLSDDEKKWGPFTWGSWNSAFGVNYRTGSEDDCRICNSILITGFKKALRIWLPNIIKKGGQEFGVSLSREGNGYDFLQVHYGPQTWDSSTTKSWCKHLPWKMWNHVRHSVYNPDGSHYATKVKGRNYWSEWYEIRQQCPRSYFGFEDNDGELIVASCRIEEREWHRGEGWFKWLRFFYRPQIQRTLDLEFSAEVGPGKGSWKGGTIGHSIDMKPGETPEDAFRRYCSLDHKHKGRGYQLKFIGPCNPPKKKGDAEPVQ